MALREFVAILSLDEDVASRYSEVNGLEDCTPGDYLEKEIGWVNYSGISLSDWALVDEDVSWEEYLRYLVQWAIDHHDAEHEGMSPASYDEWRVCDG